VPPKPPAPRPEGKSSASRPPANAADDSQPSQTPWCPPNPWWTLSPRISPFVRAGSADDYARLHARAKPVERAKRPMRPVREQDAELAIQCVGTILCELGWAEWA